MEPSGTSPPPSAEARDTGTFLIFDEADSLLADRRAAERSWEVSQVNEMLTWMESHPLPFACTTNFGEHLDAATLRRFVFKVALDCLSPAQAEAAFRTYFGLAPAGGDHERHRSHPRRFRRGAAEGCAPGRAGGAGCAGRHAERRMRRQARIGPGPSVSGCREGRARAVHGFRAPPSPARVSGAEPAGPGEGSAVRYERLKDIVTLAIRMQGLHGGMTVDEIRAEFGVSRRTAERMRDAVEWAFGPLQTVERNDNKNHWRLRSDALRRLVPLSGEELAELGSAAETLERTGFEARAAVLRELDTKLRATLHADSLSRIEADIEALVQAEGLAMRPGPRPQLDRNLLALLREAIITCRVVALRYLARSTGQQSWQRIEPLRPALRQPPLPGGTDGLEEQDHAAVAPRQHERGPRDERELHARPRFRSGGLRQALLRHLPGGAGGRGAAPFGRGGTGRICLPSSTPARRWRRTPTAPSRCASPPGASTRCAGTSSPGARA